MREIPKSHAPVPDSTGYRRQIRRRIVPGMLLILFSLAIFPTVLAAAFSPSGDFPERLEFPMAWGSIGVAGIGAYLAWPVGRLFRDHGTRRQAALELTQFGLIVGILVLILVLADLLVYRLFPMPVHERVEHGRNNAYGWAFDPREPIVIVNPDTGEASFERTNGRGWRDVDHPEEKSVPRLLLIGDSMVYGAGLPFEETLGRQLQAILGDSWEVLQVGIGGWGTTQEKLFLEKEGLGYQPDVVVLLATLANDVLDNVLPFYYPSGWPRPRYTIEKGELVLHPVPPAHTSPLRRFFDGSAICLRVRLLLERAAGTRGESEDGGSQYEIGSDMSPFSLFRTDRPERMQRGLELTERLFLEMKRITEASGARFLLYPFEQPHPLEKEFTVQESGIAYRIDLRGPYLELEAFCDENGIEMVRESDETRTARIEVGFSFENDPHYNATGIHWLAETIAASLDAAP